MSNQTNQIPARPDARVTTAYDPTMMEAGEVERGQFVSDILRT